MTVRDRTWLRTFLRLDARAATLSDRDVHRQEDTVLRALDLLDTQPGVVLADEVGMGKTYEALGVMAARMHANPNARILVLTPGPDLNIKWKKDIVAFADPTYPLYRGFVDRAREASTLAGLIDAFQQAPVVIAPVTMFSSGRGADRAYLLSLWCELRGHTGNKAAAVFRRYHNGELSRVSVRDARLFDRLEWSRVSPAARAALEAHAQHAGASLDTLMQQPAYSGFEDPQAVDAALADLRFRLVAQLIPHIDLLVIDEAHKLKNAETVRATGVRTLLAQRFDKALFLTATPFQLTVNELSQMFALFALARGVGEDVLRKTTALLADIEAYTLAYGDLERAWAQVDGPTAATFGEWFAADPTLATEPEDANLRVVASHARRLLALKRERIEPGLRSWMIRSLREDKRQYRRTQRTPLQPTGGAGVPFLLYERFIAELFRSKTPTHKAAVQINMVSSYSAAREGALLRDTREEPLPEAPEVYRKLLQNVVGRLRDTASGHPKVGHVVQEALAAAERDEKTLIFCARRETVRELKREIEAQWHDRMLAAWQRVYPGATITDIRDHVVDGREVKGRHDKLRDRFQSGQDALYLALRERYVATLLEASADALARLDTIVPEANAILVQQTLPRSHAEKVDWSLAKRCVEQAATRVLQHDGLLDHAEPGAVARLLHHDFVPLGFDLEADDVESTSVGSHAPTWRIDVDQARRVLAPNHLWTYLKAPLLEVPPSLRVRTVERLAGYLVSSYVPFLPALMAYARAEGVDVDVVEARALLPVVDRFWTSSTGRVWCDRMRAFLVYATQLTEENRTEVLDDAARAGAIVRHTVDGESRERLREAFNTPLYPMILIANEVMQEGLDLHHHCRRVVHHDLAWNPAQLEQRVGRIDRLGSLLQRMRAGASPDATLDIGLPVIARTIDERLERTVRMRERWLEFLLGGPPKLEGYGDGELVALPEGFAEALRVGLGPTLVS